MQRKLKEIYAPADSIRQQSQMAQRMESMGLPGQMSKPSQQQYQQTTQHARREMDQMLSTEVKRQEQLSKTIEGRIGKVKALREEQEKLTKGSAEELAIKEKISRMDGNNGRLREIERGRSQAINQTMEVRQAMNPKGFEDVVNGYKNGGGIRGAANVGKDILKNMSPGQMAGMIGSVIGAAGIAAKIGGELYREYKQAPINTASSYGNSMSGVMGREVNNAYAGRSGIEMSFIGEKREAMKMASEAMKGERKGNAVGLGASIAIGAGAGAAFGAPALGLGAIPGAIIGGIGGGIAGYYGAGMLSGGKTSALAKSPFSDTHNAEYEGMMAQEFAEKYGTAFKGLKDQSPYKTAASEHYQANYMQHLDTQRSMGLENYQFHGFGNAGSGMGDVKGGPGAKGYRQRAIDEGFTDNMAMQASSGILGAGGSTSMARNSVFGLQAGRQFNQTNASSVLGNISNSLGSSQASESAYIKMLAEGTRQGLDTSTYAAESRQMMEVQAQALNKSGSSDVDRVISQMGGFLNEKTGKGIESAKNAFDYYNEATSDTGGPTGVLRFAAAMKDPILGKMSVEDRNSVMGYRGDQLDPNTNQMAFLKDKYKFEPEDIIKSRLSADKVGFYKSPKYDKSSQRATDLQDELKNENLDPETRAAKEKQLRLALGESEVGSANYNPGKNPKEVASLARGHAFSPQDITIREAEEKALKIKMEQKGGTGKQEDNAVILAAEDARVVLENFHKFGKEFVQSPEAVQQFNKEMRIAVEIINKLAPALRAKAIANLGIFEEPKTQSQSGKASK